MKSLAHYFDMTTILADFQICISVPLNEGKTEYTFFHKFPQKDNIPLKLPMLAINGKVFKQTISIKFLGILFDEHFSWKKYI